MLSSLMQDNREGYTRRAVVSIVRYDDLILLGKKRNPSKKFRHGKWHIPGETCLPNETETDAVHRGIM